MGTSSPVAFTATSGGKAAAGRASLVRAALDLYDPPVKKGDLKPGAKRGSIPFQFNPKELSVSKGAKWNRDPQKGSTKSPVPEFMGPEPAKLTVEMFLDAGDGSDDSVVAIVEQLFSCCIPTPESHDKKPGSPPWVVFHWGGLMGFTGYVSSVQVKYTRFTPTGIPVRGTATVAMEEVSGERPPQNPTSGGLAARLVHTVVSGDTLASIAYREYGDPAMWRHIAERNGIDDPMRLRAGTTLLVPAADELGG
jgi:nucleoid-associated protein YgaU